MPAVVEDHEPSAERASGELRRFERNRVLASMDDQGGNRDTRERRTEIEISEAAPNALLHATHDAKWREVVRACGVCEVAGDTELEAALTVSVRVALAQAGVGQVGAQLLYNCALLASREFSFELLAVFAGDGGGVD